MIEILIALLNRNQRLLIKRESSGNARITVVYNQTNESMSMLCDLNELNLTKAPNEILANHINEISARLADKVNQ
jgi:hypothetical protein